MGKIFISFTGLLFRPSLWFNSFCSAPPLYSAPCTGCHFLLPNASWNCMQSTGTQNAKQQKTVCKVKISSSYKVQKSAIFPKSPQEYKKQKNLCLKDALTPKLCYKTGTLLKMLSVLQWKAVIQVRFMLCFNLREKEKNTTLLNFKTE